VPSRPVAILDACVLINILASGRAQEILTGSAYRFAIGAVVSKESVYLRASDPNAPPEAVELDSLVDAKCLAVHELSGGREQTSYVDYAADLDDGEAMTVALALSRGWIMATDDRKARRIFLQDTGNAGRLLSTAQILKGWSLAAKLSAEELRGLLVDVSRRGRFSPRSDDPDFDWWSRAVR
jgi:hypothetical protein